MNHYGFLFFKYSGHGFNRRGFRKLYSYMYILNNVEENLNCEF